MGPISKYYRFTFADGYSETTIGYDRIELQHMIAKHGAIIKKVRV